MLENLHVKDLALISEADISFKEGLNILTGETGAGKSIILGSVNLALGQKAGADVIRSGADTALIELSFSLTEEEKDKVLAMDLPVEEDGMLILSRKIQSAKSICRVNGETVTLSQVRELRPILLNIYGQHEHQSLLKASTYERMLDEYAGENIAELKNELSEKLRKYRELKEECESDNSDIDVRKRQMELLSYEINEIESANLKTGEDEELEKRYRFLNNARRIMENVSNAHMLTGFDSELGAGANVGRALGLINSVAEYDDGAMELAKELSQIDSLISDFNRSVNSYIDSLTFDEAEFSEVEDRLNTINRLKDKYGQSIEAVLESLDVKSSELCKLEGFDEYLLNLKKEIDTLHKEILKICRSINELRVDAAPKLTMKLKEAMEALNFLNVELKIDIESDENKISADGYDQIEFRISLNPGEDLRPMQTVASGGELSRIMLAFKSVFADKNDVSTLVFDEIDTGISGVTAYKVAEKMNELGYAHQIICITHLPQIAAMADTHFLIEKKVNDGRTITSIEELDNDASVRELARMLGSDEVTQSAIDNAIELKKKGGKYAIS